jgi:hypothetical protein
MAADLTTTLIVVNLGASISVVDHPEYGRCVQADCPFCTMRLHFGSEVAGEGWLEAHIEHEHQELVERMEREGATND